ncbi:MAG TPA: hypothetical protein VM841_02995 [Actinomycetota bacterium]|nr:hypothetical protein [Actinomycetota bacterium]
MMRRVALGMLAVLVPLLAAGLLPARAASAPEIEPATGRIVVVLLNGTSLEDWLRADTFHLRRAIREGTPGLLSARTAAKPPAGERECLARPGHAMATLMNGTRSRASVSGGAVPLREALRRAETTLRLLDTPVVRDSSFPTGRRADQSRLARQYETAAEGVVIVDIPDTLYADCAGGRQRDRWVSVALGRADATIGVVRSSLEQGDRMLVMSAVPPAAREDRRNYLAAATLENPVRDDAAILTSPTTRRRGVVSLTDAASTIVALAGGDATVGVGRRWGSEPGTPEYLRRADRDFTHAASIRLPVMRGYVWLAAGLIVVAAVVVLAGRGRARGGRLPRTGRDWLATLLVALVAAPAAMLIEPLTGVTTLAASVAVITSASLGLALVAGAVRRIPFAAGVCAGIAASGLIAFVGQGELGARSALSYSIAGGDRFFGVGNEMMGVAVAGALLATGQWLDARRDALKWAPPLLLLTAGAMAAPSAGAKFGSIFVAVPAFGLFLALAAGRRPSRAAALGIAIATVFLAGIFAAWDLLADPASQSHVARVVADDDTLGRKIGAALRLLAGSYWTIGLVVASGVALLFVRRRTTLLARATWARPHHRAALIGCGVAAVAAVVFNDAGIVAAALIAIVAAASLLHTILVGQSPPVVATESIKRLREFAG